MTDSSDASLADLLHDDLWLRRFVASLVADHEVDDLAQETWLAALRKPPRARSHAWLARVGRNFAKMHARSQSRRRSHEREAARHRLEALPSTEETVQRIAAQELVARAVGALPAAHREVVILRWYHGLAYSAIAEQVNTSEANARQRAARGLALVRQKLEQELGSDWRAHDGIALLALPMAKAQTVTGLVIAALAVVSVLGVSSMFLFTESTAAPLGDQSSVALELPTVVAPTESQGMGDVAALPEADPETEAKRSPVIGRRAGYAYRGTLRDPFARPIAGARVVLGGAEEQITDEEGGFELWVAESSEMKEIRVVDHVLVLYMAPTGRAIEDALLIAGRPVDLRIVATAGGRRIPGVTARVGTVPLLPSFDLPIPQGVKWTYRDLEGHDEAGFLRIEGAVPGVDKIWLEAPGNEADGRVIPEHPPDPWRIEYSPPATMVFESFDVPGETARGSLPWRESIGGRVLGADGRPLAGATVSYKGVQAESGTDGKFSLSNRRVVFHDALTVTKEGLRPLILENFSKRPEYREPPEALILRLDQKSLEIVGQVLDSDGEPIEGLLVFPADPVLVTDFYSAEDLAAGTVPEGVPPWLQKRCIARTGKLGRFKLDGLYQRDYILRVMDLEDFFSMVSAPIATGIGDAQLEFERPIAPDPLAGRVVDSAGKPIADATVSVERTFSQGKPHRTTQSQRRVLEQTDEAGRFDLRSVPADEGARLQVDAEGFLARSLPIAEFPIEPEPFVLYKLCPIRIVMPKEPRALVAEARDLSGQMLPLRRGNMNMYSHDMRNFEPVTYLVSEQVFEVVIKDFSDRVQRRIPVTVHPERITEIQL